MDKHINEPWQGGTGAQSTRVWARVPGGDVIISDFSVSASLRHETKVANAARARLCVNFCADLSNDEIERLMAEGIKAKTIVKGNP